MTNFRPFDWGDDPSLTVKLVGLYGFDFSKLKHNPALLHQVAGLVFDYIFDGKSRDLRGPKYGKLVEYGVARFGNLKDIIADEPLALLAAVYSFTTEKLWTLQYFLKDGLSTSKRAREGLHLNNPALI
ncbi:hypothetical protein M408DRAFT_25952 [Serendipita vermifera MAFF 305830]|uniref:Uncharacterized protein n=1 Tax=Serendipita vermifera MAFF 305830 TaxID=933852 RepID=A0A0C3AMM5_SERVB|nr:hypothetical protein M408DRAFT_25952 [Serendipita vermifera MAFF 305830]